MLKEFKATILMLLLISTVSMQSCKKEEKIEEQTRDFAEPAAMFDWAGEQVAPAKLVFTNTSQNAERFKWDFGNGAHSEERFPGEIAFSLPGTYDVLLTAFNGNKKNLMKKTIVIAPDNSPIAQFTFSFKDNKSYAPATLVLVNNSQNATTYEWEINAIISYNKTPTYVTFTQAGDYVIKLIAIKNGKRSPIYQQTATVLTLNEPRSGFSLAYHPFPYQVGEEIQLFNTSLNSDSWLWTFGANGPSNSTEEHPIIKFNSPGDYPITLIAKKGASSAPPKTITIRINP